MRYRLAANPRIRIWIHVAQIVKRLDYLCHPC